MAEPAKKFFVVPPEPEPEVTIAAPLRQPRSMTAAAEVLDFKRYGASKGVRAQAWQKAAWDYYDQVGELKFAFNLISQVVGRVMLYAAISEDTADVPMEVDDFLKTIEDAGIRHAPDTKKACDLAAEAMRNLVTTSEQSELLRTASLNMSIAGECYLYQDREKECWSIASIEEFIPGDPPRLQSSRSQSNNNPAAQGGSRTLPKDVYAARIWRKHPRWSMDADSSMLGVLDQVEKVVLFDQVQRAISRSRLNAGLIWIPTGVTIAEHPDKPVDVAISDFTKTPVENESSLMQVSPLILSGAKEQGEPKRVELARQIDEQLLKASELALDRMLAGLDIPKDVVKGLSEVKYANSVIIDDSLYKAHIEPLVILICDALTSAYLYPLLRKNGVEEKLARRFVIWYNPSQIVTRPDRSQSANEGYDRGILSARTWRAARGYSELDAPDEKEMVFRMAWDKAQVPPEMASILVEALAPNFFQEARAANQAASMVPPEVAQMLGQQPGQPAQSNQSMVDESPATTQQQSGGQFPSEGVQPPPPAGPGPGRPGPNTP